MDDFVERLNEGHVKEWYKKHVNPALLETGSRIAESRGYVLDPNSGLYVKSRFSEHISLRRKRTDISVIFMRPSDFHVHDSMDEAISVVGGRGSLFLGNGYVTALDRGKELYLSAGVPHSFIPYNGHLLEIDVACSREYTPDQERQLVRFDKIPIDQYNFASTDCE